MLTFALPSLIGFLVFLTPIEYAGQETVFIGLLTDWIRKPLEPILLETVVGITVLAVLGGAYYQIAKPDWDKGHPYLRATCHVTPVWLALRSVGALIGLMVYFQAGPELVWGAATGRTVFVEIGTRMFVIFLTACMLMPFLTDFGFMEFIGTLVRKVFARLFRLPGRSAIDATASFVAAASVGLLITINQYERGYYSARESAAVATNFSVVSIPFSLVVAEVAGVDHIYFSWYLTVIVACLVCALITIRIPPLSRIPDIYFEPVGKHIHEVAEQDMPLFKWSVHEAMERARSAPGPIEFLRNGTLAFLDVVFGVIGPAMAIATVTAIVVFHTPVFEILSYPIYWILNVAQVPEAETAAPGFLVGFLDQFMPALVAKDSS
jgi:nucleoside recognition membrane protein YjiH